MHGMPVSFLVKEAGPPKTKLMSNLKPCVNAKNFVFVGLKDVEIQELNMLKQWNISYFSMRDIDNLGIKEVMARALDIISPNNRNKIHVSFDVDSIDQSMMESTGTPVLGGLTEREAMTIGEIIHSTGQMATFDLVEFNPMIGTKEQVDRSAKYINEIVLSFFGKSRFGSFQSNLENQ